MAHAAGFIDITASGTIDLGTLLPFRPKAALWWTAGTQDGFDGTSSLSLSHGFAVPGYQSCVCVSSDTIVGLNDCGSGVFPTNVLIANNTGTPEAGNRIKVASFDECNLTLTVEPFGPVWRIFYLIVGGRTLVANAGDLTLPGSGASTSVTGIGRPDYLHVIGALTASAADARYSVGMATGPAAQRSQEFFMPYITVGNAAVADQHTDTVMTTSPASLALTSFDTDGFTVTASGSFSGATASYLTLADENGAFAVNDIPWSSGSLTAGFQPDFLLGQSYVNDDEIFAFGGSSVTAGAFTTRHRQFPSAQFSTEVGANSNFGGHELWRGHLLDEILIDYVSSGTLTGELAVTAVTGTGASVAASTPGGTVGAFQYAAMRLSNDSRRPCSNVRGMPSWPRGSVG